MATYTSSPRNGYILRLITEVLEKDPTNNRTKMKATLYIVTPRNHRFEARSTGDLYIGSTKLWSMSNTTFTALKLNTAYLLGGGEAWVTHDGSGRGSASIKGTFKTETQGMSWSVPPLTVTVNIELETLVRGPVVRHEGSWKPTNFFVKFDGEWRKAVIFYKSNGVWRGAGG